MTLPASITLTQTVTGPVFQLADGSTQPALTPSYAAWLTGLAPAVNPDNLSAGTVFFMVVQPATTDSNGQAVPAFAYLATLDHISTAVVTGSIVRETTTSGLVSSAFPNLPTIPTNGGNAVMEGFICAQDTMNPGFAKWTFSYSVVRDRNATMCFVPPLLSGDAPSCGPEIAYGTLANLGASPTLGADAGGVAITVPGFDGLNLIWSLNTSLIEVELT